MKKFVLLLLVSSVAIAQAPPLAELIDLARQGPAAPGLKDRITKTLGAKGGNGVWGQDYLFVVEGAAPVTISLDNQPAVPMTQVEGSTMWMLLTKMRTGVTHSYQYYAAGKPLGARGDAIGYNPDSYSIPAVARGKVSEKLTIVSKIYEGMKSDYWVYASPGVDPAVPAALMVWQDGQGLIERDGSTRAQIVFDNLTHQKKIPVMIHVFIQPGQVGEKKMRSIEYDTVSYAYARFLRDEVLPEVYAKYNIRKDGYSRAIAGNSSGGICAFNVAWFEPDQFSRVLSRIGSFTSIQWKPGVIDGGNVYPFKIRKEAKRNIRVWLQDGTEDLENEHGSWPLQNLQMANSLKMKDYDFHLSLGNGTHNGAHSSSELPEEMVWLWRDYDPAKTSQTYEMDAAEKAKPLFRVKVYNRE
jgi:enterochelin esterase family protein